MLNKQEKQTLVADVRGVAQKGLSAVVAEYRGLSAVKFDQLRSEARKQGVYLHVVKNTLARIAVEGTEFECLKPALVGPVVLGLSLEDPGAVGRVIKDFAKANDKLVVKAVAVGGKLYDAAALERLASLPTKDQALSQLLGVLKAPLTKLARTLAEPAAMVARAVQAVADKQGAPASADAAPAEDATPVEAAAE